MFQHALVPNRISAIVRSGYVAANSMAIGPPSDTPSTTVRSEPTASITARASSIRTSSDGSRSSDTRSDSPTPRLSNTITRANDERCVKNRANLGSVHICSTCVTQPITNRMSTGPSPNTWYAMWMPSAVFA